MASTLVRLSNQILLEYFYEEESYKIGQSGLRRVDNRYEDSITLVNDAITGNYSKFTVVNTNTDNVLLDENGTYHYYDENVNIQYKKVELTDYNIFKYGYSTKDKDGKNIINTNWLTSLLYKINLLVRDNEFRGAGLSICKDLLRKNGGDIMLVETSKEGTTFRLKIPVKVTHNSSEVVSFLS